MKPRTMGFGVGVVLAALSWIGNQERVDTFTISTFPDLLTIFAVPAALYFALRFSDRRQPGQDVRHLRRTGWTVANTAAAVFALAMAIFSAERFPDDPTQIASAFLTALFLTAGIGYLAVEVWARLIVRVR